MKAEELRIGNETKQGTVISFYERGIHVGYGKCFDYNEAEPIPLTEEWLLNMGFEIKQGVFGNEYWGKINLYTSSNKKIVFCFDKFLQEIKHVHQLQNLYHALTNNELTIKL